MTGDAGQDAAAGGCTEEEGHENQVEDDGPDGGEERERVSVADGDARVVVVGIIA